MSQKPPVNNPENHASALMEQAYSVATQPEEYDQLVLTWEKRISEVVKSHGLSIGEHEHPIATGVDEHLLRAFDILHRLSKAEGGGALSLADFLAAYTCPALLARSDGSVRAANEAAHTILGVTNHVRQIAMDGDMARTLRERLAMERATSPSVQTVLRAYGIDKQSLVLVLSPYIREQEETLTLILTAEINWTSGVDQLLREGFGLTSAESAVTNAIMLGQSLSDIVEHTGKSINTVRSQLSSILSKTGARKQSDLVRLVAGISQVAAAEARQTKPAPSAPSRQEQIDDIEEHIMVLPNGRRIAYRLIGPKGGRWALFNHGMLTGPYLSEIARKRLKIHNVRLLAVARPGYGETSPAKGNRQQRHQIAGQDMKAVMTHLGTGPCVLLGQEAGGGQGYALAHFQPGLILAQVNFSSGIPFTKPKHIAELPPRMRGYMYTARLAPQIMPLMIRGAVSLFQKGRLDVFHKTFYHGEGLDYEVSQRPHVAAILQKGAEFSQAQGHDAILHQAVDLSVDWSNYLENFRHPTILLHGRKNSQFPWHFVRDFANEHDNVTFVDLKDAGLLLMHTHGDLVIDTLHRQMQDLGQ
jgi:pimeloyl-ACP methyl ester carboxylesterase/DNA-binding CsgD family transcriptional regulator